MHPWAGGLVDTVVGGFRNLTVIDFLLGVWHGDVGGAAFWDWRGLRYG